MNKTEAASAVALLRELWPSKFHWQPGLVALWFERLARPEWSLAQVEAVIRQMRTEDDGAKPSMKRVIARCWEVHGGAQGARKAEAKSAPDNSPAEDRARARAWYAGLSDSQLAAVVERASEALPLYARSFARHITDAKYQPNDGAMLMLKAGHRLWGEGFRGPKATGLLAEACAMGP